MEASTDTWIYIYSQVQHTLENVYTVIPRDRQIPIRAFYPNDPKMPKLTSEQAETIYSIDYHSIAGASLSRPPKEVLHPDEVEIELTLPQIPERHVFGQWQLKVDTLLEYISKHYKGSNKQRTMRSLKLEPPSDVWVWKADPVSIDLTVPDVEVASERECEEEEGDETRDRDTVMEIDVAQRRKRPQKETKIMLIIEMPEKSKTMECVDLTSSIAELKAKIVNQLGLDSNNPIELMYKSVSLPDELTIQATGISRGTTLVCKFQNKKR